MLETAALDWSAIDTVLLDMDGTLLDQRFDNWFWLELIPSRYAAARGLSQSEASALLAPKFRAVAGTIRWYCIDYWSEELDLDIVGIKRSVLEQVGYLPGAREFLLRLKSSGKRLVLVTNAHPVTFAIKNEQARLTAHFDACYSTHPFDAPKEDAAFWPRFNAREPFVPQRTLFVDDSIPVLDAARGFGITWLRAVRLPDSGRPAQDTGSYAGIDRVADLM
ncbi:MAG TPA: GMP/IMP nucleotidase [Steroidobacteraceae bacterium]|nr:GMP/IMP nucleotidase [Steroidobacteraceae bacterium]